MVGLPGLSGLAGLPGLPGLAGGWSGWTWLVLGNKNPGANLTMSDTQTDAVEILWLSIALVVTTSS